MEKRLLMFIIIALLFSSIVNAIEQTTGFAIEEAPSVEKPLSFFERISAFFGIGTIGTIVVFEPSGTISSCQSSPDGGFHIFSKKYTYDRIVSVGNYCSDNSLVRVYECKDGQICNNRLKVAEANKIGGTNPKFTQWNPDFYYAYLCYSCEGIEKGYCENPLGDINDYYCSNGKIKKCIDNKWQFYKTCNSEICRYEETIYPSPTDLCLPKELEKNDCMYGSVIIKDGETKCIDVTELKCIDGKIFIVGTCKKEIGEECKSDGWCKSDYCNPQTNKCDEPLECTYGNWGDYGCIIKEGGICGPLKCSLGERCERRIKISGGIDCPGFDYRCVKDETCIGILPTETCTEAGGVCASFKCTYGELIPSQKFDCLKLCCNKEAPPEEPITLIGIKKDKIDTVSGGDLLSGLCRFDGKKVGDCKKDSSCTTGRELIKDKIITEGDFDSMLQAMESTIENPLIRQVRRKLEAFGIVFSAGILKLIDWISAESPETVQRNTAWCIIEEENGDEEIDFCFSWVVSLGKGISGDATDSEACTYGWIAIAVIFIIIIVVIPALRSK